MEPVVIGSKNPRLRRLRRLNDRSTARSQEWAFVVDGPVLVAEVLRSGLEVQEIFAGPGVLAQHELGPLIDDRIALFEVEPSVLQAALDPVSPRPLAAVVSTPRWTFEDLTPGLPILVAVELRDPGNLGTLFRTAEAAGLGGIVVVGESVDPFSPKVVRASAGSIFRLPMVRCADVASAMAEIRDRGWPILSAVVPIRSAGVEATLPSYDAVDLTGAAIVVGNEPHGLSAGAIRLGDGQFTIPLSQTVESLNVAAAAAVLCFEAARQRRLAASEGHKSVGQQHGEASGL